MCRCVIEGITAQAQRVVNHERWLRNGRPFVGVRKAVMQGDRCVGVMCSKTMAKRTANALNGYKTNREGV